LIALILSVAFELGFACVVRALLPAAFEVGIDLRSGARLQAGS
jgi:hypothetical protein